MTAAGKPGVSIRTHGNPTVAGPTEPTTGVGEDIIVSEPPVGGYKLLNTYYDGGENEQVLITPDVPEE